MIHRKSQLSVPKTRNPYIRHSIYCKPYYVLGSVLSFIHACGGFQALPGHSRRLQGLQGLQGPPGVCRGLKGPQTSFCALPRTPKAPNLGARLKFHAGWSGWTRPGGGVSARGLEGVFEGMNALRLDASANYTEAVLEWEE